MSNQAKLQILAQGLNGVMLDCGLSISAEIVEGEVDVLAVTVEDREEFPIYITVDESQTLCISHLWTESEVKPAKRMELLEALLTLNVPMPLSAFSKVGNQYLIFGSLRTSAGINELVEEIETLSDNTLAAVEELADFLVK